jgi:hypothetical protein
MTMTVEPTVEWSQDQMVEVVLNEPDDFLKVRETLTRIGVASRKEKKTLSVMPHPAQAGKILHCSL